MSSEISLTNYVADSTKLASKYSNLDRHYVFARSQYAFYRNPTNPMFFENAGGSQVPDCVSHAIKHYMQNNYVQLGAGYPLSNEADKIILKARKFLASFFNSTDCGDVIVGNSTTQLLINLAYCYSQVITSNDEIIVQVACHEANIGPWVRLAKSTGATLKWWTVDPHSFTHSLADLSALLTPKTRIVAVTHVSNILGEILDLPGAVRVVRERGGAAGRCAVVADGVAYAPHAAVDVRAWGVDWYVFSTYKTWGPHMAALYGSRAAFDALLAGGCEGPNHYFVPRDAVPYRFEPGGVNHEGCAAVAAIIDYFRRLAATDIPGESDGTVSQQQTQAVGDGNSVEEWRAIIVAAYRRMEALERPLTESLIEYLQARPEVVLVGPGLSGAAGGAGRGRVPTISFVHRKHSSAELAARLQAAGLAVRNGHFYAHRLLTLLLAEGAAGAAVKARPPSERAPAGRPAVEDGVVRISLAHYNTPAELDYAIQELDKVL